MALTPDQIAALSLNDLEFQYLGTLGATGALDDRRTQIYGDEAWTYYAGKSGLTPASAYMLPDHQYAYFKAQTGLTSGTLTDLSRAFWGGASAPDTAPVSKTYTELAGDMFGPERGWFNYTETHFTSLAGAGHVALSSSSLSTARAAGQTVVFRYYVMEWYLTHQYIDQVYLDLLTADFAAARTAGVKLLIRFTYSTSGKMTPPYGDAPIAQWVFDQQFGLYATLNANADVIYALEAGMIGMWGEWYYTDNFGDLGVVNAAQWTSRSSIIYNWLDLLDPRIFVLLRYPGIKIKVFGNPATDPRADRLGFHNDAFVSGSEDLGTYTTFNTSALTPTQMRAYVAEHTLKVPMLGESAAVAPPTSLGPNAKLELATYHWDVLNPLYEPNVLASWTAPEKAEIGRRLGYRLTLVSANLPTKLAVNQAFTAQIVLANTGYAAPRNNRKVFLTFRTGTTSTRIPLTADVRNWAPGANVTLDISATGPATAGTYTLSLEILDNTPAIQERAEYSVQLATTGAADASTRNLLGVTVVVT